MSAWFAGLQKALPQHGLSRLIGKPAASEIPWLKNALISLFRRAYDVDLTEAERSDAASYTSFNDFFTRALKDDARPIADGVVCPADGAVSQAGMIERGRLLQAKGHSYSLESLAGELSGGFDGGTFCTIYLAPRDYHRVHLPFDGTLTKTLAMPGALYSVNAATETAIEGLFARNERLICRFDTELGPMLVVLVGAMIVASIETIWEGPTSPYSHPQLTAHSINMKRGAEIGRFLLGSTVICCFPAGAVELHAELQPGRAVRMGQQIGRPASL